jgi:hypothetical protein
MPKALRTFGGDAPPICRSPWSALKPNRERAAVKATSEGHRYLVSVSSRKVMHSIDNDHFAYLES